jgi:hypothetical protein
VGNLTAQAAVDLLTDDPDAYASKEALVALLDRLDVHAGITSSHEHGDGRAPGMLSIAGSSYDWLFLSNTDVARVCP